MKVEIIPSNWLIKEGHRLDCQPFTSGGIAARMAVEKLSCKKDLLKEVTLDGLNGIYHVGQEKIRWVESKEYGIPFLRSSDILRANLDNLTWISKEQVSKNPLFLFPEGATLITRSGTIGRTVYARKEMSEMAASQDVLKVVADPNKILSGYLYAYISSSYGIPQVISGTFGSVIVHIEAENIANLPVPRLGEDVERKVHELIDEVARLRSEYQLQVREATNRLFASVGLKDITASEWHKMKADLGFSHNLSSHTSLRAANFNPRFKKLCETIKSKTYKELHEICIPGTLQRGGRYKRIDADPEFGCQLIGQRQLFWLQPEGRWVAKSALGDDVFVEPGTILIAAQGTLGESELYCRSEFIWSSATLMAYSEHLLRVIADETIMLRGCLFAFMRSETAFRMFRSSSMGSKLQDHHPAFIPHLPVPYPDKKTQQEIHELVVDAYKKRHRSNALEDEAVAIVESAISKGDV